MTDEQLGNYIRDEVTGILEDLGTNMVDQFQKCDPEIQPQMVALLIKSISLSSQISIQYTLRFLENAGLLHLPESGQPLLSLMHAEPLSEE